MQHSNLVGMARQGAQTHVINSIVYVQKLCSMFSKYSTNRIAHI